MSSLRSTSALLLIALSACNRAPAPLDLSLIPEVAYTTDDLVLDLGGSSQGAYVDLRWTRDGQAQPDLDGTLLVRAESTTKGERWEARAFIQEGELIGESSMVSVLIQNSAPVLTGQLGPNSPGDRDLTVAIEVLDADNDPLDFSYEWTRDGEPTEFSGPTVPSDAIARAQQWEVSVVVNDGENDSEPLVLQTTIDDVAPQIFSVEITPNPPITTDDLTVDFSFSDRDDDPLSFRYEWTQNGVLIGDATSSTLSADQFIKGDTLSVRVWANDGYVDSEPSESQPVVILNSPPSLEQSAISPGLLRKGSRPSCEVSGWTDLDDDPQRLLFEWRVNGLLVDNSQSLGGGLLSKGDSVRCIATPYDDDDQGLPVQSEAIIVSNTAPTLASVNLSALNPRAGEPLSFTVNNATDDDGDPIWLSQRWFVNELFVSDQPQLSGALYSRNDRVHVEVIATDGEDDSQPVSSEETTVQNSPPVVDSVVLAPDLARTNDPISASVSGSDLERDPISYTYRWEVNGIPIDEASPSLPSTHFIKDDLVELFVIPNDGLDDGPAGHAQRVILNSAPVLQSASITPATAYTTTALTCSEGLSSDADGDAVIPSYQWTVNGVSAGTLDTLDPSSFIKGDTIGCSVTLSDGTDTSDAVLSQPITVLNSAPTLDGIGLSSRSPRDGDVVEVILNSSFDSDGDRLTYSYEWFINGSSISAAASIDGALLSKGDSFYVQVIASDGTSNSPVYTSDTGTVVNSPPLMSSVTLSPSSPTRKTTVTVNVSGADSDGDPISYTYQWTINGNTVSGPSQPFLWWSHFSKGDLIEVSVTPNDGTVNGPTMTAQVTIQNTPPEAPEVVYSPTQPSALTDLQCLVSLDSFDIDLDSISYTFDWTVDNARYTGTTTQTIDAGDTIPASKLSAGAIWECSVTPNDGTDNGPSTTVITDIAPYVGTVQDVNKNLIDVRFELCGDGTPGQCTASQARIACNSVGQNTTQQQLNNKGQRLIAHASDTTTSAVRTLGATVSNWWSTSYYTPQMTLPAHSCLVAVSNLQWAGGCGNDWNGQTYLFDRPRVTVGMVFNFRDSGYDQTQTNYFGTHWASNGLNVNFFSVNGCQPQDTPAANEPSCTTQFVACAP